MRPIPVIGDPERYIDSAFVESAFIELKSCDLWDVKMLYPILHMDHAEEKCFVRKEMYERLVKAAGNLPDGYRFRIWDAWRPFALFCGHHPGFSFRRAAGGKKESCDLQICLEPGTGYKGASRPYHRRSH
mgnify:CR=1 FL=1